MVFDLKIPDLPVGFTDADVWKALLSIVPKVAAYTLSFIVVAIMWLSHHMIFAGISHSTPQLIWYNAFLLFAMSLIPLPTAFLADHPLLPHAAMFYGIIMSLNMLGFNILRWYLEEKAKIMPYNRMVHRSNIITLILYVSSIPLAFVSVYISFVIFVIIPVWYFLPDKFQQ